MRSFPRTRVSLWHRQTGPGAASGQAKELMRTPRSIRQRTTRVGGRFSSLTDYPDPTRRNAGGSGPRVASDSVSASPRRAMAKAPRAASQSARSRAALTEKKYATQRIACLGKKSKLAWREDRECHQVAKIANSRRQTRPPRAQSVPLCLDLCPPGVSYWLPRSALLAPPGTRRHPSVRGRISYLPRSSPSAETRPAELPQPGQH